MPALRPSWALAAPLVVLAAIPMVSRGDVVVTTNGDRHEGTIVEETPSHIVIEVPEGRYNVDRDSVRTIERESLASYHIHEAERRLAKGDLDTALGEFSLARVNKADAAALAELGFAITEGMVNSLLKQGRLAEARRSLVSIPEANAAHGDLEAQVDAAGKYAEDTLLKARRTSNPQEALTLLRRVLSTDASRFDELRSSMAKAEVTVAISLLRSNMATAARAGFLRASQLDPGFTEIYSDPWASAALLDAEAMAEAGRHKEALAILVEAEQSLPGRPDLLYGLGVMYRAMGMLKESYKAYCGVTTTAGTYDGNPASLAAVAEKALEWVQHSGKPPDASALPPAPVLPVGKATPYVAGRFKIVCANRTLAEACGRVLESVLPRILSELSAGHPVELAGPVDVTIHKDETAYLAVTGQQKGSAGVSHASARGQLLVTQDIQTFETVRDLTTSVLPHELAHVAFRKCVGGLGPQFPLSFHEGMAIHFEPDHRKRYYGQVARSRLAAMTLPSFKDVATVTDYPEDRLAFYAQSSVLVEYLIQTKGLKKVLELCLAMDAGNPATAFEQVLGPGSLDRLDRDLKQALGKVAW